MKRKILKAVGYIMLAIGIIGGLSTIEMIFNGNLAIWIMLLWHWHNIFISVKWSE